ncbi:excalibur calcium-binding domain-containing protein [Mycobacterium sp. MMS18-G62]
MIRLAIAAASVAAAASIALAPAANAACPYRNCSEAFADGVCNIPSSDPCYWKGGDRDHDGIACECP